MALLGIISGTIVLREAGILDQPEEKWIETAFGPAQIFLTGQTAFISRHGTDAGRHILPHRINHRANISALLALGVKEIVAVSSTGSMNRAMKPGMFVIPDDFIMLYPGPAVFENQPVHMTPTLDGDIRQRLRDAARDCGIEAFDGGVYWQTAGPRFETKAEIRLMSQAADLVGMTMASEAIAAKDLGMAYASLCSVDNYAHGLVEEALTMEDILRNASRNTEIIARIIKRYMERRGA